MKRRLVCLTILAAASCAVPRYTERDAPAFSISLWVERNPDLDAQEILQACREWSVKGVVCSLAQSPEVADVRIMAQDSRCTPGKDGNITLAYAYHEGRIELFIPCLRDGNKVDKELLHAVTVHEIGHVAGIWEHVTPGCGPKSPLHPSGQHVCGRAVMNPLADRDLGYVTKTDALAFDLRERGTSLLRQLRRDALGLGANPPPPDCTLLRK